uniref:Dyp-type peroxidase n=1 Tax=Roseihalotalea indica TaxID=2867963 RepID=A0AA49JGH3_9BACT|nr:Dyp-type peroxidase [Tunicatimonas sp. TK19036]
MGKSVNKKDIQGMLLYGYKHLRYADYLLLRFAGDRKQSQQWLKTILPEVANGQESPTKYCYAIALGKSGLEKFDIEVNENEGFSRAFIEGMDTDHRNRILGDYVFNSPEQWRWGSRKHEPIDVLLVSFADSEDTLEKRLHQIKEGLKTYDLRMVHFVRSSRLDPKEHFGFADGISQPIIKGSGRKADKNDLLNAGEFIFGYPNEYQKMPHAPLHIGENGSYLVFRQLEQKVKAFWDYLLSQTSTQQDIQEAIYLGAKMVGRWPNGSPTTLTNDPDDTRYNQETSFRYHADLKGTGCPHGAHIRRTNPRDSVEGDPVQSLDAARKHRILRRGRAYGKPLSDTYDIEEMIKAPDESEPRGLNFICFNTDIERQFEFVQNTWCNNEKFDGLYEEVDPISGVMGNGKEVRKSYYKIPENPFRRRLKEVPPFVEVKGGGYFFFPGLSAIHRLIHNHY